MFWYDDVSFYHEMYSDLFSLIHVIVLINADILLMERVGLILGTNGSVRNLICLFEHVA